MIQPPSILVVDDELANRTIALRVLTHAGWNVEEAANGADAIVAAQERDFALILMDIQMPGTDGFAATRQIRAAGGHGASVPILAFTAIPPGDAIARARAAGMDGHIAKPFTPETLLAAVTPWRPEGGAAHPTASLAAIFGKAEVASLLARFRDQLIEALTAEEEPNERRSRAHKIAGISGTLGFKDVSRQWLAVSEGDESAWDDARTTARRALRTIDSSPEFAPLS
jgi:CheY-like chemotaxis protein